MDQFQEITLIIPRTYYGGVCSSFTLLKNGQEYEQLQITNKIDYDSFVKYVVTPSKPLSLEERYDLQDERGNKTDLQVGGVIRSPLFDEQYAYDGEDLGATYSKDRTIFKLWAPTAFKVRLRFYLDSNETYIEHYMKRTNNGVWEYEIEGDCEGFIYTFLVCVNLIWREAVDPYTKAVTVNGERGVVIDLSKTPQVEKINLNDSNVPTDYIIYETSIRDFTSFPLSGVRLKSTYEGFIEEGTKYKEFSTCFDYIKKLGVTHIELLPFFDFVGIDETKPQLQYNWGYNPLNFNVPEGSYSSAPTNPIHRIIELKKLLSKCHENGLQIIMDVVYNHVYELKNSHFEKIVPGYYFRQDESGLPSNGTGVGNDFATERMMARNYIIHSLKFWLKEYDLDGFRFDLMGIIDIETMNKIEKELRELKKGIILFGEGWELNTPLPPEKKAIIAQSHQLPTIGFFNDRFRDTIKGSTFSIQEIGFISGQNSNPMRLVDLLSGSVGLGNQLSLFSSPIQTINYVESHDNHTLWDRLTLTGKNEEILIIKKRHLLATAMVILSIGVPFIHSGQEFFRSKKGVENSYNAGDVINSLNWETAEQEQEAVEYVKTLISIRKKFNAFRLSTKEDILTYVNPYIVDNSVVGLHFKQLKELDEIEELIVLFHNGIDHKLIPFIQSGEWEYLLVDGKIQEKGSLILEKNSIELSPISCTILVKY
jgi:pullulanase